jgi:hypothetical protein
MSAVSAGRPSSRRLARPTRVLAYGFGLYLMLALVIPARVEQGPPPDGVTLVESLEPALPPDEVSLLPKLAESKPRVERAWLLDPIEVQGQARLSFELYQLWDRELMLYIEQVSAPRSGLRVRLRQQRLPELIVTPENRTCRWGLPAELLVLGENSFDLEVQDDRGRPSSLRVRRARVRGGPASRVDAPRLAWASLGGEERPALVQPAGSRLGLELPGGGRLLADVGLLDQGSPDAAHLRFHLQVFRGPRLWAARTIELKGASRRWRPLSVALPESDQPLHVFWIVEGRATGHQRPLWASPRLVTTPARLAAARGSQ